MTFDSGQQEHYSKTALPEGNKLFFSPLWVPEYFLGIYR